MKETWKDIEGCGWTLTNIFFFTPIKPGVLEVYEL